MKISLGCGRRSIEGFVGLDSMNFGWNIVWNAGDRIPFQDNYVGFIQAYNFIEHVSKQDAIHVFNESWRVLCENGIMEIITPDASKSIDLALADPTHVSMWVKGTFAKYMTGEKPRNADYGIKPWKIIDSGIMMKEIQEIYL